MKPPGGETPALIRRLQPGHFGSKAIHYRAFRKSQRQTVDGGHTPNRRRIFRIGSAMEEYRRRLERIQINICVVLTLALFGGLLVLPRIGQIIWIAIIAAVYVRLTVVIGKREELLEKLHPPGENNEHSVMYDARERRMFISVSKGSRILGVDPKNEREGTEIIRQISSSYPGEPPPKRAFNHHYQYRRRDNSFCR
jgi:hypothetical protein